MKRVRLKKLPMGEAGRGAKDPAEMFAEMLSQPNEIASELLRHADDGCPHAE